MSGSQAQQDFRVHVGFFSHRKTLRLFRDAGEVGVVSLLRLWAYAAENHPDGFLGDVEPSDLAAIAGWPGDAEAFLRALEGAGFIDAATSSDGGAIRSGSGSDPSRIRFGVRLHDWREHQPYIANREARQVASKRANEARWKRRKSLRGKVSSEADPHRIRVGGKAESPSSSSSPNGRRRGAEAAAGSLGPPPRPAPAESDALLPMLAPPRPIANARVQERRA